MLHPVTVIGIGSRYRRDDAVGIAVINRLRSAGLPSSVTLATADEEPARLVELWSQSALAIVVDPVTMRGSVPGRMYRLDLDMLGRVRSGLAGRHGPALGAAIELARELDRMPGRLLVYAVEIDGRFFGETEFAVVRATVDRLVARIEDDIAAWAEVSRPTVDQIR